MNKKNKIKIITVAILIGYSHASIAQTVSNQAVTSNASVVNSAISNPNGLGNQNPDAPTMADVPNYADSFLRDNNCDPAIWNKLRADYLANRQLMRDAQSKALVNDQKIKTPAAPNSNGSKGKGKSCIESAMDGVNHAMDQMSKLKKVGDAISSIYFKGIGNINWAGVVGGLGALGAKVLDQKVCSEINNAVGGVAGQVNQEIRGVNQSIYTGATDVSKSTGVPTYQIYQQTGIANTGGIQQVNQGKVVQQQGGVKGVGESLIKINPFK